MEADDPHPDDLKLLFDVIPVGKVDRPPFRLSGGEKQRAAVASVFSFDPEVLLLNEPLGAVDAQYRERILGLLDDHDGTVLVFTPSLDLIPKVAKRVVLVGRNGSIAADGTVRDVLTDRSLLESQGLRPPATVRLFEVIVDPDVIPLTIPAARRYLSCERM
ncbi:putative ABC transporter ATP-binding protein [Halalkalicoccus paucihalophilus]|uniref:Putative ABC transporter ATP-binding protein n=1 Tax=Halalkalicoccus paucihalophilus TaxID=1008153 RepID=A0A151A8A9_9EURY|nr:hypothetical protein [Halalkalicoccus paucihalophilus]KYH23936.1 putative ABC transporter ATP-binding protein [Halalkalicoccus paucihalophilus]